MLWFSSLSDTLQGVVIGSIVTILGVVITSAVNAYVASRQLRHDREQKERDRQLALRREVLLGLAEVVLDTIDSIHAFADLSQDHVQIVNGLNKNRGYLARLHLVGSEKTVEAAEQTLRRARLGFVKIRLKRNPLLELQRTIEVHETQADRHLEAMQTFVKQLMNFTYSGETDDAKFERLERAINSERDFARAQQARASELRTQLRAGYFQMNLLAQAEEREAIASAIPLIAAARAELGEEIDLDVYRRIREWGPLLSESSMRELHGMASSQPVTVD